MGQDIRVVVRNEFNFLRPTSTNMPLAVTGLDKVIQIVTKALLSEPGRDIFNRNYGVGLRQILIQSPSRRAGDEALLSDLTIALLRVEEDVKRIQDAEEAAPEERLASLKVSGLCFDRANTKWEVVISVITEARQQAEVPVVI